MHVGACPEGAGTALQAGNAAAYLVSLNVAFLQAEPDGTPNQAAHGDQGCFTQIDRLWALHTERPAQASNTG